MSTYVNTVKMSELIITSSAYNTKTKPRGFLAKLEKAEESITGFLYKRGKELNVLFTEYTKGADPSQQPNCYKFRTLQESVPDGWDKTSRESLPGNTVDNVQFSLLASGNARLVGSQLEGSMRRRRRARARW